MIKLKKVMAGVLVFGVLASASSLCAACTEKNNNVVFNSGTFDFSGSETFNDEKIYHFNVKPIVEENGVFELTCTELSTLSVEGEWKYEAKKGFSLAFDDNYDTVVYTTYKDSEEKFYFNYFISLGDSLGEKQVSFSADAKGFATEYDGAGLATEKVAVFSGEAPFGSGLMFPTKLVLNDDGTCKLTCVGGEGNSYRNGTYTYDATTKKYSFVMDEFDLSTLVYRERDVDGDGIKESVTRVNKYTLDDATYYTKEEMEAVVASGTLEFDEFTAAYDATTKTFVLDITVWNYTTMLCKLIYTPVV